MIKIVGLKYRRLQMAISSDGPSDSTIIHILTYQLITLTRPLYSCKKKKLLESPALFPRATESRTGS